MTTCYACNADSVSQEHAPPKCLFPESKATFATNVRFDEPDILCTYGERPFAVAAKFIHSDRQIGKNIRKGRDQATGRSPAANVVDLLPLDELYNRTVTEPPRSPIEVVDWLKDWAAGWCETPSLKALVDHLRKSKPLVIGVAFFMPFLINWHGNPMPSFYTHMPVTWSGDEAIDFQFTKSFLRASQAATSFAANAV
jgi:hypothetical protein